MQMIYLENVYKSYGGKIAVNNLSFSVKKGEIFGLLGGNGAGKTSTMRMILGISQPDKGIIKWSNKGYTKEVQKKTGYLPEERGLFPKQRISDQIIYLGQLKGMSYKQANVSLCQWLKRFNIMEYYNKKLEELSKGNQQKIQFIASVIHDPDLLILDEVFSGLDPVNVELVKDTILDLKKAGKTIIFSSHRMDHVEELCENICLLDKSHVVLKGNLNDIKETYPREKVILECKSEIVGLDESPYIESVLRTSRGYEIKVSNHERASDILEFALRQSKIIRFQVMEPTLNDIFIEKVGKLLD